MPKMYTRGELPPCPDPDKFILVRVDKLYYWRRKRGTVKPATLNDSLKANSENISPTSKAAKEILQKLAPTLAPMFTENRLSKIGGLLMKGINKTGVLDYSFLKGLELPGKYPLKSILKDTFTFFVDKDMGGVKVQLTSYSVKPAGKLLTHYFFELVLVCGEL